MQDETCRLVAQAGCKLLCMSRTSQSQACAMFGFYATILSLHVKWESKESLRVSDCLRVGIHECFVSPKIQFNGDLSAREIQAIRSKCRNLGVHFQWLLAFQRAQIILNKIHLGVTGQH